MLLNYARVRESRRGRYAVRIVIEHVLKLVESEAKRRGVQIIANLGDRPLIVECDPDQLQQVFVNLAVNAFDAMAPKEGKLRVSAAIGEKDYRADLLKVTFEDSGTGVPPEFREELFDPFFTTKPPRQGHRNGRGGRPVHNA
jgi:C4-dicarboxylate-specific signal transduction histidine kinase